MRYENQFEKNLYTEKNLYLLNIRELRDIGRKLGVPAPATLKKQALVDYILKIVYGEVEPPKRSAYGRPNVRDVDINNCITKIMKRTDFDGEIANATLGDIDSIFKVASSDESSHIKDVEQRFFVEDNGKYFLRKYSFVESQSDIEVPKIVKEKYSLLNFDVVEAVISGKFFRIVSINGNNVEKKLNKDIKNNEKLGKKQVFHLGTKEEINKTIKEIIKENDKNDLLTIIFSNKNYSGNNVVNLKTELNLDNAQMYKNIMQFINTCEKHLFDGEVFVVVTDQSKHIESVVESLESDVSMRTKKYLQEKIQELLDLGNGLVVLKNDTDSIYWERHSL